jgi:hypothetical protein
MQVIKKVLQLDRLSYYERHLEFINCLLPEETRMTNMELKVLAKFMSLEGDIAQHRFGPTGKKVVREHFDLSYGGLSNYLASLLKKQFLERRGDMIYIWDRLNVEPNMQEYAFRLINKDAIADN